MHCDFNIDGSLDPVDCPREDVPVIDGSSSNDFIGDNVINAIVNYNCDYHDPAQAPVTATCDAGTGEWTTDGTCPTAPIGCYGDPPKIPRSTLTGSYPDPPAIG